MHLSIGDLLEIRDGEAKPDTALHVAMCPQCAAEVERLRAVAAELKALPVREPPRDRWPAVRAAFTARRRRRRVTAAVGSALALAASIVLLVVLPEGRRAPAGVDLPQGGQVARGLSGRQRGGMREADVDLAGLVRESQRLEEVLQVLRPESRVLDVREASTVADLEDRIALIDQRLGGQPSSARHADAATAVLWQERVGLMNRLVRAHDTRPAYIGL